MVQKLGFAPLRFSFALSAFLMLALPSQGAMLYSGADVNPSLVLGGCEVQNPPIIGTASTVSNASCGGLSYYGNAYTALGSATGIARFDQLSAETNMLIFLGPGATGSGFFGATSGASASFADVLHITSTVQPSFVTLTGTMHGEGGLGELNLQVGPNNYCEAFLPVAGTSARFNSCSVTAPVVNGAFSVFEGLQAIIEASFSGDEGNEFGFYADFSNTAYISSIQFFDANMDPLTGVQFISDSGTIYPTTLSDVPEPATLSGVLIGALVFTCVFLSKDIWYGWSGPQLWRVRCTRPRTCRWSRAVGEQR